MDIVVKKRFVFFIGRNRGTDNRQTQTPNSKTLCYTVMSTFTAIPNVCFAADATAHDPFKSITERIMNGTNEVFVFEDIAFTISFPHVHKKEISTTIGVYRCNACRSRAKEFLSHFGPNGPLFLDGIDDALLEKEPPLQKLRRLAMEVDTGATRIPHRDEGHVSARGGG